MEGVLLIAPGHFAARGGDWIDFVLTLSLRQNGSGGTALTYHVGGSGSHILVLLGQSIEFQRESEGQVFALSSFRSLYHRVSGTRFSSLSQERHTSLRWTGRRCRAPPIPTRPCRLAVLRLSHWAKP